MGFRGADLFIYCLGDFLDSSLIDDFLELLSVLMIGLADFSGSLVFLNLFSLSSIGSKVMLVEKSAMPICRGLDV